MAAPTPPRPHTVVANSSNSCSDPPTPIHGCTNAQRTTSGSPHGHTAALGRGAVVKDACTVNKHEKIRWACVGALTVKQRSFAWCRGSVRSKDMRRLTSILLQWGRQTPKIKKYAYSLCCRGGVNSEDSSSNDLYVHTRFKRPIAVGPSGYKDARSKRYSDSRAHLGVVLRIQYCP